MTTRLAYAEVLAEAEDTAAGWLTRIPAMPPSTGSIVPVVDADIGLAR